MKRIWNFLLDKAQRTVSPWLSLLILISGPFVAYDFSAAAQRNPAWRGLFDFLGAGALLTLFLIAGAIQAIVSFGLSRRDPTMQEYKEKIIEYEGQLSEVGNNIRNVFDGLLFNLAKKIDISPVDRISIYIHDNENQVFIPCGRYSQNAVLARPGRTYYPENEGCISKGWENGWHFDNSFPITNGKRRQYESANYGLDEWVVARMRMQSNLYAVLRLDNSMGEYLAVLVVESTSADRFDEADLREKLDGAKQDFARMIGVLRAHIPNPLRAQESGL